MCCTLKPFDLIEADVVVVESTLAIAVDLLGEFHERAHPFLQVIRFMEVHEVDCVRKSFFLFFTRLLLESLLIFLFRRGCSFGLCLERPRIHASFGFTPDALLIEVVVIVGGICGEIHLRYGCLSK